MLELDGLQRRIVKCADVTLQAEGVTARFKRIDEMIRRVREVVQELEGVLCSTMEEADAIRWLAENFP